MTGRLAGAPRWNCVDYPGEGMHLLPSPSGGCQWCGKSLAEIDEERAQRTMAWLEERIDEALGGPA